MYRPDRRGHGRTPDVDGPISYELMARDTIAFIERVVGGPAYVVGHSDGAPVGLLVALRRPDLVRRLVFAAGVFHHDGWIPGAIELDEETTAFFVDYYGAVSPDGPEHFPVVAEKLHRMHLEEPALTPADLARIPTPTLVMVAESDEMPLEHTLALYDGLARRAARRGPRDRPRPARREARAVQRDHRRLPHPGRVIPAHPRVAHAAGSPTPSGRSCMSNLIAVAYPDLSTAQQVAGTLTGLQKEKSIVMDDIVVVERRPDGKIKLHQAISTAGAGAAGGALWGGLIGLLFLAPLLGMAVGAAAGGAAGAMTDAGVDDNFMKELGTHLDSGGAAVVVLVRQSTPDKVLPRIQEYGGKVVHTSLSNEAEERLQAALGETATA